MSLLLGRTTFGDTANIGNLLPLEEAEKLLLDWVPNPRLRLHMKQVAGLMKAYAAEVLKLDPYSTQAWELAGLLHDADWEQWPELHCK